MGCEASLHTSACPADNLCRARRSNPARDGSDHGQAGVWHSCSLQHHMVGGHRVIPCAAVAAVKAGDALSDRQGRSAPRTSSRRVQGEARICLHRFELLGIISSLRRGAGERRAGNQPHVIADDTRGNRLWSIKRRGATVRTCVLDVTDRARMEDFVCSADGKQLAVVAHLCTGG